MTSDVAPSEQRPAHRWLALDAAAALTGSFLGLAYISGRLYLSAYYGVFGVSVTDLALSVQDLMFSSLTALFGSLFSLSLLVAATPMLLGLYEQRRRSFLTREASALDDASSLAVEIDSIRGEAQAPVSDFALLERARRQIARWVTRQSGSWVLVPLVSLPIVYLMHWDVGGHVSAAFATASFAVALVTTWLLAWFYVRVILRGRRSWIEVSAGVVLFVHLVLSAPWMLGALDGLERRYATPFGSSNVVSVTTAYALPGSRPTSAGFESDPMLLLGQNGTFVILWSRELSEPMYVQADSVLLLTGQ